MQQPSTKAIEKARWVWECSEPEFTSRDTWLTDSTRRAVAAAYAIDVAPLEREISRLAAALTESQRALDNVLAASGMDALLSERDALRTQREQHKYVPMSDAEMPTDREWTTHEWAMNQWYLANERAAQPPARPTAPSVAAIEAAWLALPLGMMTIPDGHMPYQFLEAMLRAAYAVDFGAPLTQAEALAVRDALNTVAARLPREAAP